MTRYRKRACPSCPLAGAAVLALVALWLPACSGGTATPPQTLAEMMSPEAKPSEELLLTAGPLGDKTLGSPSAPVTVIEYASLTCPYCRKFHAETFAKFKKAYIDTGKVYFIFREFPIGRSAAAAALAVRCAADEHYFTLNERFLASQPQWTSQDVRYDAIYKVVQDFGVSRKEFDTCQKNQKIIEGLMWVKERGRKLGVAGTPTFFVNGRKARGALTFEDMRKLVESALRQSVPSAT